MCLTSQHYELENWVISSGKVSKNADLRALKAQHVCERALKFLTARQP